jgi:hypothetical protein
MKIAVYLIACVLLLTIANVLLLVACSHLLQIGRWDQVTQQVFFGTFFALLSYYPAVFALVKSLCRPKHGGA